MRVMWLPLLLATFGLLVASSAAAQTCQGPPGVAAIDEYCEVTPEPAAATAPAVSARTVGELEASGRSGRELVQVLGASARRRGATRASSTARRPDPVVATANPLDAVGAAVDRGDRVGSVFPWVLVSIAAAFGAGWLRSRRRTG